jgi:DNA repair photolyase
MADDRRFEAGPAGTVISIGCLSEPLAPHSLNVTVAFLAAAKNSSNPIQVATRWVPREHEGVVLHAALLAAGAVVFHSFSTLSRNKAIEAGTPRLEDRLAFVRDVAAAGIPSVLYIKPFILGITSNDAREFVELAVSCGIRNAVIGPLYESALIADALLSRSPERDASNIQEYRLTELPVSEEPQSWSGDLPSEVHELERALSLAGVRAFSHSRQALARVLQESESSR